MALRRKSDAENGNTVRQHVVNIKRIDEEEQVVYGEVYAPFVLDTYGEFMTATDIKKMAHRFMKLDLANVIDTNHDNLPNGSYPVESYIAADDDPTYTPGAWVLGVKVSDSIWPRIKSGELNGYSFQAMVKPVSVEVVYSVIRDHVGNTQKADDNHTHTYFVEVDVNGKVVGGTTDVVNGHTHTIRKASVTEVEAGHSHRYFL